MPSFKPLQCSRCEHTIRGCMFRKVDQDNVAVCETCYREGLYGDDSYLKAYKHCILRNTITAEKSQKICRCSTVPHLKPDGNYKELFPVGDEAHRGSEAGTKGLKCGLLNLGTRVAEAKYEGMLSRHEKHIDLGDQKRSDDAREERRRKYGELLGLKMVNQASLIDSRQRIAERGRTVGLEEDDESIPFFMRKFANKYPFGNVHMALRFGPLLIENGVEQ